MAGLCRLGDVPRAGGGSCPLLLLLFGFSPLSDGLFMLNAGREGGQTRPHTPERSRARAAAAGPAEEQSSHLIQRNLTAVGAAVFM